MKFEQALQAMREGKIVHRTEIDSDWYYQFEDDNICRWNAAIEGYYVSGAPFEAYEILAEDWEVVSND